MLTRFRQSTPVCSRDNLEDNLVPRRYSRVQANVPIARPLVARQPPVLSASSLEVFVLAAAHDRPRCAFNRSLLNAFNTVTACICTPMYDMPWQMPG